MLEPGIDVIVVNYRTSEDLKKFVESYDRYSGRLASTLWIANVAPDLESRKIGDYCVDTQLNPTVHLVHEMNVGFSYAANDAASKGNRSYLGIFNADTELTPYVLEECVAHLAADPDCAIVGPKQVNSQGRITHGGILGTLEQPTQRGWKAKDSGQFSDVRHAVSVMGSAFFIKRHIWDRLTECPIYREQHPEALGAFLPTPHYYEETWCSYHAQAHGFHVAYLGTSTMIHEWHGAEKNPKVLGEHMANSRKAFRAMCDAHGIPHD